jgi:hypothetical protein
VWMNGPVIEVYRGEFNTTKEKQIQKPDTNLPSEVSQSPKKEVNRPQKLPQTSKCEASPISGQLSNHQIRLAEEKRQST